MLDPAGFGTFLQPPATQEGVMMRGSNMYIKAKKIPWVSSSIINPQAAVPARLAGPRPAFA